LEEKLGLRHQTVSARLTELKKEKLVVVVGSRKTRTGSTAGVNCEVKQ
jgi:Mn-dependent DtxR family transcriptional regulator